MKCRMCILLCMLFFAVSLVACGKTTKETSEAENVIDINHAETVIFGTFEGEPIEWDVLDKDEDGMLLISHNILTERMYHREEVAVTWEDSEIRVWLNGEFYDNCFTAEERSRIQVVTNKPENTEDKVFLLGINELKKYYGIDESGKSQYSNAAIATYKEGSEGYWWLRTTDYDGNGAMGIFYDGAVGSQYMFGSKGVRPVLRLAYDR